MRLLKAKNFNQNRNHNAASGTEIEESIVTRSIDRRTVLRGAGVAALLPLMESISRSATPKGTPPKRLVFLNFGYGPSEEWYPDTTDAGEDFSLPDAMKPLKRHRRSFSVLSNLTNINASNTGSHWGSTTFLTGADVRRTPGREFHNDISCDHVAAKHIGKDVRYASLALTGPDGDIAGCGPGSSLSWDSMGNPIQGIADHVALFSLLFGDGGMSIEQRRHLLNRKRSVLDAVRTNAKSISGIVSSRDRQKVDEYFTLIRSIEGRLTRNEDWLSRPKPESPIPQPASNLAGTTGVELMFDLMVAALQTDSTRVISYRMPTMSLLREYGDATGRTVVGSHPMTHFGTKTSDAYKQLAWRDEKVCDLFATLLDKMQAVPEPDGSTLLENSLIVMGSSLRTGHRRRNLPILFAGGGGGGIRQGQHLVYKENESALDNLWLSMLRHVGCPVDSFAGSDGVLPEIFM